MAFNIVAGVNNAVYGSVSGSGSYEEGAEVTLEVTENDGYRFVEWSDGSTDNPRVFNASEDLTLMATLEAIPEYTVTLSANNDNLGSTSGAGSYREGSVATISAIPSSHCRFVKWDDNNTDNPRTLTVNAAVTLEAIFETVNWYTISTSVNDATMGSVTGAGDYDEGDTVTLTATANTDYKFVMWRDENTDNPRTFTASASGSYEAVFAEIVYADVTIASNDNELGTVSGAASGSMAVGTELTLTATPETDCKFDGWQVDGEFVSTDSTLNLTVIDDVDIVAVFSAIVFYQLNLISSDTECGTVSITSASETARGDANNIYPEGTVITVAATPTSAGKFLNWSDGSLELTRTIYLTENTTLRANFYPASGLILVAAHKIQKIWTTIKSFFSAPTGASKIGVPANNALGATTLADVVNSAGQPGGIAILNNSGKVAAADIDGTLSNDTSGNAATASVADKVGTSTVGSSTEPVYINAGTPTACGSSLAVDITGNAATATTATKATTVTGSYTQSGGKQNPNYFGTNKVGFLMMNTTVNSNTQYKDWIIMDCYNGNDVGGGVAFGVNRQSLGAYIMRSAAARTSWAESAELIGTHNYTSYTVKKDGTGASGSWGISVTGSSASCTGNAATATKAAITVESRDTWHSLVGTTYNATSGTAYGLYRFNYNNSRPDVGIYIDSDATSGVQRVILNLGNNIANTTAAGKNGLIRLWGTGTTSTDIIPANPSSNNTLTLPTATGTIALTSSDITGSSASCTGNAATATSATTATNANNLKVTHTGAAWRDILSCATGFTSASNQAVYGHNSGSVAYYVDANATSGNQRAILRLGNATANTTAAGHNGELWLYSTGTTYNTIKSTCTTSSTITFQNNHNITWKSAAAVTLTLPSSTGTLALTSDITSAGVATQRNDDNTYYTVTELTFANSFKMKIVQWKGTALPTADQTITYKVAFAASNSIRAFINANYTKSGSDLLLGMGTNSSKAHGGHIADSWASGYSSVHAMVSSNTSFTVATNNNPIYMAIIVGY